MKHALFAALLAVSSLSACAGGEPPASAPTLSEAAIVAAEIAAAPAADRLEITAAVSVEVAARFHCPVGAVQSGILAATRTLFDVLVRSEVQPESAAIVDRLRARTDEACAAVPAGAP